MEHKSGNKITEEEIKSYLNSYNNLSKLWSCRNRRTIELAQGLVDLHWQWTGLNKTWLYEWALLKEGFLKSENDVCAFFTCYGSPEDCSNPNHAEGKPKQTYHFCCVCGNKQHGAVGTIHEEVENECRVLTSTRNQLKSLARKLGASFNDLCAMFGFGVQPPPKQISRTVCLPTTAVEIETPTCPPPKYVATSNRVNVDTQTVTSEAACMSPCESEYEEPTATKVLLPIEIKFLFSLNSCTKHGSGSVTTILLSQNPADYIWMVNVAYDDCGSATANKETKFILQNYNYTPGHYSVDMVAQFVSGANFGYVKLEGLRRH